MAEPLQAWRRAGITDTRYTGPAHIRRSLPGDAAIPEPRRWSPVAPRCTPRSSNRCADNLHHSSTCSWRQCPRRADTAESPGTRTAYAPTYRLRHPRPMIEAAWRVIPPFRCKRRWPTPASVRPHTLLFSALPCPLPRLPLLEQSFTNRTPPATSTSNLRSLPECFRSGHLRSVSGPSPGRHRMQPRVTRGWRWKINGSRTRHPPRDLRARIYRPPCGSRAPGPRCGRVW